MCGAPAHPEVDPGHSRPLYARFRVKRYTRHLFTGRAVSFRQQRSVGYPADVVTLVRWISMGVGMKRVVVRSAAAETAAVLRDEILAAESEEDVWFLGS